VHTKMGTSSFDLQDVSKGTDGIVWLKRTLSRNSGERFSTHNDDLSKSILHQTQTNIP
jgi:hypothetical protein